MPLPIGSSHRHQEPQNKVLGVGNLCLAILLCVSVAGNLALAHGLLRKEQEPVRISEKPKQPLTNRLFAAKGFQATGPTFSNPPFYWSDVASADLRQYAASLRALGCSEQIVKDIIAVEANQLFALQFEALMPEKAREYWEKPSNSNLRPEHLKKLMAVEKEFDKVLKNALGPNATRKQELIDLINIQVFGVERQLLFLPSEKRQAALQALWDSGYKEPMANQSLGKAELKILSNVLSPQEMEEFRLRNSPETTKLRMELQYFNFTPEEFKLLARERSNNPNGAEFDLLNRDTATQQARKLFGEERAREFDRVTDLFYLNARRTTEELGLPAELAEQAWQIYHDTRNDATRVASDSALSISERKRRIETLSEQGSTRINGVLGEEGAWSLRRELRTILKGEEAKLQP